MFSVLFVLDVCFAFYSMYMASVVGLAVSFAYGQLGQRPFFCSPAGILSVAQTSFRNQFWQNLQYILLVSSGHVLCPKYLNHSCGVPTISNMSCPNHQRNGDVQADPHPS